MDVRFIRTHASPDLDANPYAPPAPTPDALDRGNVDRLSRHLNAVGPEGRCGRGLGKIGYGTLFELLGLAMFVVAGLVAGLMRSATIVVVLFGVSLFLGGYVWNFVGHVQCAMVTDVGRLQRFAVVALASKVLFIVFSPAVELFQSLFGIRMAFLDGWLTFIFPMVTALTTMLFARGIAGRVGDRLASRISVLAHIFLLGVAITLACCLFIGFKWSSLKIASIPFFGFLLLERAAFTIACLLTHQAAKRHELSRADPAAPSDSPAPSAPAASSAPPDRA